MRERGIGRRRYMAIAAVLIALSVAAPEAISPAGAAAVRTTGRTELSQSRPAGHATLLAKRKKRKRKGRKLSSAARKAKLLRYLKSHPKVVAAHLRTTGAKLRPAALRKNPKLLRAYLKKHPKKKLGAKGAKVPPKRKPGGKALAKKLGKKKTTKKKTSKAALAAAKKKNATKSHPLGLTGWGEIALLALLPLLAVGLLLYVTDRLRQPPPPPTPKRRRRTLVITPMSRNR